MRHRGHLSSEERGLRSKLLKLLHGRALIRGSLVTMARTCGNPNCKCATGEKHVSLYLATRVAKGKRKMIYVPSAWEATLRSWIASYKETEQLMDRVSEICLTRFLEGKQEDPAGSKSPEPSPSSLRK